MFLLKLNMFFNFNKICFIIIEYILLELNMFFTKNKYIFTEIKCVFY